MALKQFLVLGVALTALGACAPRVPDSGANIGTGVGFGNYDDYERQQRLAREEALTGRVVGGTEASVTSADLDRLGIGGQTTQTAAVQTTQTAAVQTSGGFDANRTEGVQASPTNAAPTLVNNPGLSDEQSFDAVSERESIASDAARRQQQAAAYEVVAPTAVPERTGDAGPNIVAYALQTTNSRGQPMYSRFIFSGEGRFQRNCAKYRSPDEAQRDFLARGGPQRDRLGIDPDGDGFACGWDPAPFRAVRQAQQDQASFMPTAPVTAAPLDN